MTASAVVKSSRKKKRSPVTVGDKTMRKANSEIGFRITAGAMTFLGRKIYNSLVYRAQNAGVGGKGVLPFPVAYDPSNFFPVEKYWWIPLPDLIEDASAGTNNHTRVQEILRDLMSVVVERNEAGWEASHIISNARIIGTLDPGGSGRGDRLIVGWHFPEEIEDKILAPNQYTRLSLYYQSFLKTEVSLTLYEVCKRYSSSPSKLTARLGCEEWLARLLSDKDFVSYKYFKRAFLTKAINDINKITDINVALIEHRAESRGRPVESFQFSVEQKPQSAFEFSVAPIAIPKLFEQLESIGISPVATRKFLLAHTEENLLATLAHVTDRKNNLSLPALSSPAAYFKKALAENYASADSVRKEAVAKKKEEGVVAMQKRISGSIAAVEAQMERSPNHFFPTTKQQREKFDTLPAGERASLIDAYLSTLSGSLARSARATLTKPNWLEGDLASKLFLVWLGNRSTASA